MRLLPLALLLTLPLAVTGCKPKPPAPKAEAGPTPDGQLRGRIAERIDAAPYTYLRLEVGTGEAWTAVPQTPAAVGTEVTVIGAMAMRNFESNSLKRVFPVVYFGTLQAPGAAGMPGAEAAQDTTLQHALAAQGPTDTKVPALAKAPGAEGRTVAEVHAQRATLKEKTVAVQGQVVKVNLSILGRNWLHLRDGSGQGPTADLTVTTMESAAVGDVVTARGTLRLDKDYGAGYRYSVVLEDAKLTPRKP